MPACGRAETKQVTKQSERSEVRDATPERSAELADQGREVLRILITAADAVPTLLPSTMTLPQLFGHGWYRHCVRVCEACLVLLDARMDHENAALRRSLLEHTTALIWLANSGQTAIDALQQHHQYGVRMLLDSLTGDGWPEVPSETTEMLGLKLPSSPEGFLLAFRPKLKEFGLEALESPWLIDSGVAHPSQRSASYFWKRSGDDSVTPVLDPVETDHLPTLAGNAQLLFLATIAVNELLDGGLAVPLAKAAKVLGTVPELPRPRVNSDD